MWSNVCRRSAALAAISVLAACLAACTNQNPPPTSGSTSTSASAVRPTHTKPTTSTGTKAGTGTKPRAGSLTTLQQEYESVIDRVLPSIVEITTKQGLGSGIVFDRHGDIVTNDHVVGDATSFQVRLPNRAKPLPAKLVGAFPENDLAVVKVSGAGDLHPATFADSSKVRVGEIVLAMGNPLGLSSSVTDGIVSAVGRTMTEPSTPDSPGATLPSTIQTSAAINPGNSGGALVDLTGHVIGIPTLAATDAQEGGAAPGIGFAIPSNTVTSIAKQLIEHGKVLRSGRAALGVEVVSVASSTGEGAGAGVVGVQRGGGAAKAGIERGDVIVKVAGTAVHNAQELAVVLADLKVGQTVPVVVVRNGDRHTVRVTLGAS